MYCLNKIIRNTNGLLLGVVNLFTYMQRKRGLSMYSVILHTLKLKQTNVLKAPWQTYKDKKLNMRVSMKTFKISSNVF